MMNRHIKGFIRLASDLEKRGRADLSDDIDQRLKEIAYLSSLPSNELNKFASGIRELLDDDCDTCGPTRYAKFVDWTEDPGLRDLHKSLYTEEDIDQHEMYSSMYGSDFPDGDGDLSKQEYVKALMTERDVHDELLREAIKNGVSPEEEWYVEKISETLNQIDKELTEMGESVRQ
jgi:hypothetical protein